MHVSVNIRSSNAQALRVTIEEADEVTSWTPVGVAAQLIGIGSSAFDVAGLSKRYVRVAFAIVGNAGQVTECSVLVSMAE